jgi:hypothetical protein
MKKNLLAPIALFVYNRPEHTKKTVEALKKNLLADKSNLYIFSDAPKTEKDKEDVQKVRNYIKKINGFKKINLIKRKKNFGLADSIISGVTKIVNIHGKIIVLEDDLVTSKYFLRYMNDALNLYKDDKKVFGIAGYFYPIKGILPEIFFVKLTNCWGWATWKDRWKFFEKDGKKLLSEIKIKNLKKKFDIDGSYPYTKMLRHQTEGKNNSWAIRWYASTFLNEGLFLYPKISLVKNIGFDESGVHCGSGKWFNVNVYDKEIKFRKMPIQESFYARAQFKRYFRSIFFRRAINRIREMF